MFERARTLFRTAIHKLMSTGILLYIICILNLINLLKNTRSKQFVTLFGH